MQKPKTHPASKGFALIITVTMMVLLTVLVIGLLSLSTIALRASGLQGPRAVARANARLALMIALGELQKQAGQDQRVTATADMAGDATGLRIDNGQDPGNNLSVTEIEKGLSQINPGTRYWTGVWKNNDVPQDIFSATPSPSLVGWLISGNENLGPANTLTPASPIATVGATGSVTDPETAVILAGTNTVGPAGTNLDQFVAAPLVNVSMNDPTAAGRYAWWVGDEGVKAGINSAATYQAQDLATYDRLNSPHRGWETVDEFQSYPTPGSADEYALNRIVTLNEAALLDSSLSGQDSPLQHIFHSATTDSIGVLSDTLNGGLKIDLSTLLAQDLPATGTGDLLSPPATGANIVPKIVSSRMRGPKWDQIKEFRDRGRNGSTSELTVKEDDVPISPTITDLRILMGVKLLPEGTTGFKMHPCGKIAISLANPYPQTLKWDEDLELEIISITPAGNAPSRIWDAAGQPAFLPRDRSEAAVFANAYFHIPADSLAPGEARAYTMQAPVVRPANDRGRRIIDLGPFDEGNPSDFNNCIRLEHNSVNTGSRLLDVRESWTTSLIAAELRLPGGSSRDFLRRIEGIQLDNGFFSHVRRQVDVNVARRYTQPFPLHLFSFQYSQPGADYASVLPSRSLLGTRSSTIRSFADFNVQGKTFHAAIASYNPPPYFMDSSDSLSELPFRAPGGDTGLGFTKNLVSQPLPWGRSPFDAERTVLFSPPENLVSIAQLQHADLTGDDFDVSLGHQPGNAVGNSYHTPFVKRDVAKQYRRDYTITGTPNRNEAKSVRRQYFDISYLLNASLWDSYFFSTIPDQSAAYPTSDSMIVSPTAISKELQDPDTAAAHIMVNGSFNVNSTNPDAWKALLASSQHLAHPSEGAGSSSGAFFPRSLEQPAPSTPSPSGTDEDSWAGYRRLQESDLDLLAEEITKQVRLRGPFVSLAHFVNRTLVDLEVDQVQGRSGPLQCAIDESGVNVDIDGRKNAFSDISIREDRVIFLANGSLPRADLDGGDGTVFPKERDEEYPVWPPSSKDDNPGSMASILADRPMLTNRRLRNEMGFRSTGIPGWLTQADVLQVIGPSLSARSDTFRIRAYGEAVDPSGNTIARAWCEAIVQRMPEFIDPTNVPSASLSTLNTTNTTFGRRFSIVSFRWLSPTEI